MFKFTEDDVVKLIRNHPGITLELLSTKLGARHGIPHPLGRAVRAMATEGRLVSLLLRNDPIPHYYMPGAAPADVKLSKKRK